MVMVEIKEVLTKKDIKEFILFPTKLYKDCKYYVPEFYSDVYKLFTKNNIYKNVCKHKFFIAYKNGFLVGRIQAIIQLQYNELHNEKRIRFGRFDCIDDVEVSNALLDAVKQFGIENGMDTLCGPLNYTDADREGVLIEGFNELSTLFESYNYDYYPKLLEAYGLKKEVDWLEFNLTNPNKDYSKLDRIINKSLAANNLHIAPTDISRKKYIKKYFNQCFDVLNEGYKHLYGVVPFTEEMKINMIKQVGMIIRKEFFPVILDKNENVVGFGLCMPSLSKALAQTNGKLSNIKTLLKVYKSLNKPEGAELLLVALYPEYQKCGLNAIFIKTMLDGLNNGLKFYETNLNLETNTSIMSQWKWFEQRNHKRRRCYAKTL